MCASVEHLVLTKRRMIMSRRARFIKRPKTTLDATLPVPLYKQLYERLRAEILTGLLERGARLPSTRTLASELGISRSTTVLAYTQLLLEGYLESRAGQGTLVARDLPTTLFHEQTVGGAFRGGEPALDLFPFEVWARLVARRARQSLRAFTRYQPPAGYYPLREAIAAQTGITRGVRCAPEQIIITAGSQGAFDLT